jgi:hypothetical protein
MTTIRTNVKVGPDGRIVVPVGIDEAGKEVNVTIIPVDAPDTINGIPRDKWWEIFNRTAGSLPDFMVLEEGVIDPVPSLGEE